jgi:hypothetical protein
LLPDYFPFFDIQYFFLASLILDQHGIEIISIDEINNFNDIITTYSIDLSFNLNPTSYSDGVFTYTIVDNAQPGESQSL